MNNWFTVKLKYTKQLENGAFRRVTEPYLLAAMTHSDAEARIYEEMGAIIRGEFSVVRILPANFHDIFHYEDSDTWYNVKISYEGATEDSDKPKRVSQNFLVSAHSVKDAFDRIHESLSTMLVDFLILKIEVSPIVDIFPYNEELDKEISRRPDLDADFALVASHAVVMQELTDRDIQKFLKTGYNRAQKIMSELETHGIVGPQDGSFPRNVLIDSIAGLELLLESKKIVNA